MPSALTICAERPDQPAVVALLAELDRYLASLYAPEHNHILDVQALLAPEVQFFVARCEGEAVGTAAVRRVEGGPASDGAPYGEIKRMYVAPAYRGQQLGVRLIETLEAALRAQGVRQAMLETGRDQMQAVKLYERCGYTERGPFGGYPDNGLSVFYGKML